MTHLEAPRIGLSIAIAAAVALLAESAAAESPPPPSPEAKSSSAETKDAKGKATEVKAAAADDKAAAADDKAESTPVTLDFMGSLGGAVRVGGAEPFMATTRTGLVAGGGIVFAPLRSFALGLSYEHVDLGEDRLGTGEIGSANVERELHALWLDLRVHPLRRETFSIFAGIGLGLGFQQANADRIEDPAGTGQTARLVLCEASDSASMALRGGAGVEVKLGGGFYFVGDAWVENARLSGELLDGCIGGAGTTTILSLRGGVAYRLDLSTLFSNR
jgi:opacity protein-like surface antigen